MARQTLIMTGCNEQFFGFASELWASIWRIGLPDGCTLGCFDFGLSAEQISWLAAHGIRLVEPISLLRHDLSPDVERKKMPYIARLFMRQAAPGFQTYIWLDADTWVQTDQALTGLIEAAEQHGSALIIESMPTDLVPIGLTAWRLKNFYEGYGLITGLRLLFAPHVNVGVFALAATAPHWAVWQDSFEQAVRRANDIYPYDQLGLNHALWVRKVPSHYIDKSYNWLVDLSKPMVDSATQMLCTPGKPPRPIHIVHLAGHEPIKEGIHHLRTTDGGTIHRRYRFDGALP